MGQWEKKIIAPSKGNIMKDPDNPYRLLGRGEILKELAESRKCYENGEGEDLDAVIDEIEMKYGL